MSYLFLVYCNIKMTKKKSNFLRPSTRNEFKYYVPKKMEEWVQNATVAKN